MQLTNKKNTNKCSLRYENDGYTKDHNASKITSFGINSRLIPNKVMPRSALTEHYTQIEKVTGTVSCDEMQNKI